MPVGQSSAVTQNMTELDTLLADLSSARYNATSSAGGQNTDYYSDDYSVQHTPARPPPPKNYGSEKPSSKKAPTVSSVSSSPLPPARIPRRRPPKLMHILSKVKIQMDEIQYMHINHFYAISGWKNS